MIHHVVLFQLQPEAGGHSALENAATAKAMLEALPSQIDCLRGMEVHVDCRGGGNYTLLLHALFDDLPSVQVYTDHPEHLKVRAFMRAHMIAGQRAGIDYAD